MRKFVIAIVAMFCLAAVAEAGSRVVIRERGPLFFPRSRVTIVEQRAPIVIRERAPIVIEERPFFAPRVVVDKFGRAIIVR